MKKSVLAVFMSLFVSALPITSVFSAVDLYPKHTMEQSQKTEITETIALVYTDMTEDDMTDIMLYAAAAENTDVYLYPVDAELEPLLLKPTKEGSEAAFSKYIVNTKKSDLVTATTMEAVEEAALSVDTVSTKKAGLVTTKITEAFDLLSSKTTNKTLMFHIENVEYDDVKSFRPELENLLSQYSGINAYKTTSYALNGFDYTTIYSFFNISNLGYDLCPLTRYYKQDGKLTISEGKADRNMLVYAEATKAELLYISGYMATSQTVNKYATSKKIKGVSLGYNNFYISRNENPKNIGVALFTISDEVGNTATDAFEVIVKNADSVNVYYKSTSGAGTSSASTSYDKTQDDKIQNIGGNNNPSVMSKEDFKKSQEENSLFADSTNTETKEGVWGTVFSVIATIFSVLWAIVYWLLFAFAILMIVHKKFRGNVMTRVYASKYGPSLQRLFEKITNLINTYFVASRRKIKGNASLQGKFIFISHASIDLKKQGSVVEAVVAELEGQGVKCWTSEAGIDGSEDYNTILPQAIKKCAMMLLFLSPASVASPEVESEVIAGKRERKTIYPVQIAEFDLFSDDKWQHLLTQYQVKSLTTVNPPDVREMAKSIKKIYDNL